MRKGVVERPPALHSSGILPWTLCFLVFAWISGNRTGVLRAWRERNQHGLAAPQGSTEGDSTWVLPGHVDATHRRNVVGVWLGASWPRMLTESASLASDHNNTSSHSSDLQTSESATTDIHTNQASVDESHGNATIHVTTHLEVHGHQHDALLFLFSAIVLGTSITHLTTIPMFSGLQQTVVLFVLGVLFSFVLEGAKMHEKLGVFGRSYSMWMEIDPHLILFTMLPALLTGDAITLDTSVARRVAHQCIYLASVGVVINAFVTAVFLWLYLPHKWSFLLCLTTGAILCATDPVAVVALLKELGASPKLTVQIQGESLLNDGTAIVLYTIAYNMINGDQYDISDVVFFLMKQVACAWALGMVIGYIFFAWIRVASNKLDHNSSVIQVSLTLCCAYGSFIVAEGVFKISGVLANVAAALVLAHHMWPAVVSKEAMHTTWHMLEYLGNTVIFFLAGALSGRVMTLIQWGDYAHLCVIYLVLLMIRFVMLICSHRVLNALGDGTPVSIAEIITMTWGGLHGAVGLALAIQVAVSRAGGKIDELDANRVLFYVGGVAALTLVVNATTCPTLVKLLGITRLPETRRRMMMMMHRRLVEHARGKVSNSIEDNAATADLMKDVEHHIVMQTGESLIMRGSYNLWSVRFPSARSTGRSSSVGVAAQDSTRQSNFSNKQSVAGRSLGSLHCLSYAPCKMQATSDLLDEHSEVKMKCSMIPKDQLVLLGDLSSMPILSVESDLFDLLNSKVPDPGLSEAMIEAFLAVARSFYFAEIERGELVPGTTECEVLLNSITTARSQPHCDLRDFLLIVPALEGRCRIMINGPPESLNGAGGEESEKSCSKKLLDSSQFSIIVTLAIGLNVVFLWVGEYGLERGSGIIMLAVDLVFQFIFLGEVILKCIDQGGMYFSHCWQLFEFSLVILGWCGVFFRILSLLGENDQSQHVSADGQLFRIARCFRVLSFARCLRLIGYVQMCKAKFMHDEESLAVSARLQRFAILTSFVRAHMKTQNDLIEYFGTHGRVDTPELARCLLQSQVCVYKAVSMAVGAGQGVNRTLLLEMAQTCESKKIAEKLESFIMDAHRGGVINGREAESVLQPLRDHIKGCMKEIQLNRQGTASNSDKKRWSRISGISRVRSFRGSDASFCDDEDGVKETFVNAAELSQCAAALHDDPLEPEPPREVVDLRQVMPSGEPAELTFIPGVPEDSL